MFTQADPMFRIESVEMTKAELNYSGVSMFVLVNSNIIFAIALNNT